MANNIYDIIVVGGGLGGSSLAKAMWSEEPACWCWNGRNSLRIRSAGHTYAAAQDHDYGVIHRVTQWAGQMLYEPGPAADARRARALPLIAQDKTRMLNHLLSGPDLPADDTVRRRFFGEESRRLSEP